MSKITASPSISQVKPEEVQRFTDLFCNDVIRVVNGGLEFQSNFNCKVVVVNFTAANTDTIVTHNLGRPAIGYFPINQNAATSVYTSNLSINNNTCILKASSPAVVTLVVL